MIISKREGSKIKDPRIEVVELANRQEFFYTLEPGDGDISLELIDIITDKYIDSDFSINLYINFKPYLKTLNETDRLKCLKELLVGGEVIVNNEKFELDKEYFERLKIYKPNTRKVKVDQKLKTEVLDLINKADPEFFKNLKPIGDIALDIITEVSYGYSDETSYNFTAHVIPYMKSLDENQRLELVKTFFTDGFADVDGKEIDMPGFGV